MLILRLTSRISYILSYFQADLIWWESSFKYTSETYVSSTVICASYF
jgi:hypothetical protein